MSDFAVERLTRLDWDFRSAETGDATHSLHPYPAKFIPQIPRALILELSSAGDIVADMFCGSGTTLVEAVRHGRKAVGIDANPLACLISRAKTAHISPRQVASLQALGAEARGLAADQVSAPRSRRRFRSEEWRPEQEMLDVWFEPFVVEELAECLAWCRATRDPVRTLALSAFSSIVVAVSRQDSDTRYVRREKGLKPGDTFRRFGSAIAAAAKLASDFAETAQTGKCRVVEGDVLHAPAIGLVDLIVSSPPYPNAYSYHLYHRTRMLWLGMDQPKFKSVEIGSHRKYSSKSRFAATPDTFRAEFAEIGKWMRRTLRTGAHACFVVGDSTIRGERIDNASIIASTLSELGFVESARLERRMQDTRKAFNPAIGKIKTEKILILRNAHAN